MSAPPCSAGAAALGTRQRRPRAQVAAASPPCLPRGADRACLPHVKLLPLHLERVTIGLDSGLRVDTLSAQEIIGMIRDIAIISVLVVVLLVVLLLYLKVASILNSVKRTMKNAEDVASIVLNRIARPAAAGSSVAFGAGKVAAFLAGLTGRRQRRKGGEKDGR